VLLLLAVLAFWAEQWRTAPAPRAGAQYSEDYDD
jgi:hypothetical protein